MNERELRRLLKRLVLLSAPLPLALAGAACGGTALDGGNQAGAAGAYPAGGAPNGGAAGTPGVGGSGVGGSGVAGSGVGGWSAGGGGSSAGAGAVAGSSAGGAGASGAGGTNACSGSPTPLQCGSSQVTVPRSCVDAAMEQVGTILPSTTCVTICGLHGSVLTCAVSAVDAESVTVNCTSGCFTGRRPAGLDLPLSFDQSALGCYFASVARLESASVDAFRILRDELRAHGAPKKLVRAAARAARDEVRHTRATSALARRFGARPSSIAVERTALRSIEAMAVENAVEGCVRETYGALLATWQARTARDPVVRAAMRRIARDETKHAALSWEVGRWLEARLDGKAKREVEMAKQAAARELLGAALSEPQVSFADVVGLPGRAQASQLARGLARTLWS